MPGSVFLSYARRDASELARRLHNELSKRGFTVWIDTSGIPGGASWTEAIENAIDRCDALVALLSPAARQSPICRCEHLRALRKGRRVIPVLAAQEVELPLYFEDLEFRDISDPASYRERLEALIRDLASAEPVRPPDRLRTPVAAPPLPPHFVPRHDALEQLRKAVLAESDSRTTVIALWGIGGVGKTVLAKALCHDEAVQDAFPDGVIWLSLGRDPGDLVRYVKEVGRFLGDAADRYETLSAGTGRLRDLLSSRAVLIVLDDVWDVKHVEPFLASASASRLVFTTRDQAIATAAGAAVVRLERLSRPQSLVLLGDWAGGQPLGEDAAAVAQECGDLPLALAISGAMARDGVSWSDLLEALRAADLSFLEHPLVGQPHASVMRSIEASVSALEASDPIAVQLYLALDVFSGQARIPEQAIVTLWTHISPIEANQARLKLVTLAGKSLIERLEGTEPQRTATLHDLQQDYLQLRQRNGQNLHQQLLDAYIKQAPTGWHEGPDDGYFFERLGFHLIKAGQSDELRKLLFDFRWLEAKLRAAGIESLLADYEWFPDDPQVQRLRDALRLSAHVLASRPEELAGQLLGRLQPASAPEIESLCQQAKTWNKAIWLRPLTGSLMPPEGPLVRTLAARVGAITTLAVTPNGQFALTGFGDGAIKVWDLERAAELATLTGHTDWIRAVAFLDDGRHALSASDDGTLRIWNIIQGREIRTLSGHGGKEVLAVAVARDRRLAVSGSTDKSLKVWNLMDDFEEVITLREHDGAVTSVAMTPDGRIVVSGSEDRTVRVWLPERNSRMTLAGHTASVRCVAVTPDGRRAVSASDDHTLKVWDLSSGQAVRTLYGHTAAVRAVAVVPNRPWAVSASDDTTVRIWNLEDGTLIAALTGHTDGVLAVSVAGDGRRAVSVSSDGTLKVWDLDRCHALAPSRGHRDRVRAVSVTADGLQAVSGSSDGAVKVWDSERGNELAELTGQNSPVLAVSITDGGRRVVSACADQSVRLWDLENRQELARWKERGGTVTAVAMTADGRRLIITDLDERIPRVWDLEEQKFTALMDDKRGIRSVAISAGGEKALLGSEDGIVEVWDLEHFKRVVTRREHSGSVTAAAVSPDGTRAVSGSEDNELRTWDIEKRTPINTLRGHVGSITSVAMSVAGLLLVSGSRDATLKIWEANEGRAVANFSCDGIICCCAMTPDGLRIIAGEHTGRVHFFRLEGAGAARVDRVDPAGEGHIP
jgi:WD40 repeat protein